MKRLSDVLPVSFFWVLDDAVILICHSAVGGIAPYVIALGFAFLELSFDELAEWPVAIFAVSFWVAVVAQGNGLGATEGKGYYVVPVSSWSVALKAFRHCTQCGAVGAFDVMGASARWRLF